MTDAQITAVVGAGLAVLRAEARKLGFEIHDDAIALIANVVRPILGFARRYTVKTATITDNRRKSPLQPKET